MVVFLSLHPMKTSFQFLLAMKKSTIELNYLMRLGNVKIEISEKRFG